MKLRTIQDVYRALEARSLYDPAEALRTVVLRAALETYAPSTELQVVDAMREMGKVVLLSIQKYLKGAPLAPRLALGNHLEEVAAWGVAQLLLHEDARGRTP
jgi:hypothetical protein